VAEVYSFDERSYAALAGRSARGQWIGVAMVEEGDDE
jgi:hypothetical protein